MPTEVKFSDVSVINLAKSETTPADRCYPSWPSECRDMRTTTHAQTECICAECTGKQWHVIGARLGEQCGLVTAKSEMFS